jgi:hypothetical protein
MGNDEFRVGDLVQWGREEGEVVGVVERGEYADPADESRWRGLRQGVLIRTSNGEIVHVRDGAKLLQKRP